MPETLKTLLKFLFGVGVIVGIFAGIMYAFFVDVAEVNHNGMAPTLLAGDQFLYWRGSTPAFGDIAICPHPSSPGEYVIGRVMGVRGDIIKTDRGAFHVGRARADRDLISQIEFSDQVDQRQDLMIYGESTIREVTYEYFEPKDRPVEIREVQVESGIFLLGDNRHLEDRDSRSYGEVIPTSCIGTAVMRIKTTDNPGADIPSHGLLTILL